MSLELNNHIIVILKELCSNFREETFLSNDIARGTLLGKFEVFWKYGDNNQKGLIIPSKEAIEEFNLKIFQKNFSSKNNNEIEEGWCNENLLALLEYIQQNYVPDFNEFVLASLQRIENSLKIVDIKSNKKTSINNITKRDNSENVKYILEIEDLKKENNVLQSKLWTSKDQYTNLIKRIESISSKTILESNGEIQTDIHALKELLRSYPADIRDYE